MKLWKRVTACLLAGSMLAGLAACGSSNKSTDSKKEAKEEKITLEYTNKQPVSLWNSAEEMAYYDSSISGQAVTAITPYIAEETSGAGCVIICPGGGYQHLAIEKEGIEPAEALNENGISAFILEYRIIPNSKEAILSDISRAVRFVRYHAEEFGIDPDKIAVMGYSAGGHLAAMKVVHNDIDTQNKDAIDKVSDKVDCGILCYGVLSFMDPYAHKGTRENFLKDLVDDEKMREMYSAELHVTSDTPPCFVWHCRNDSTVPIQNSENFVNVMKEAGVECEFHQYAFGGHGLGLATGKTDVKEWFPTCVTWLKNRGY